jgi:AcrR family transcriptional regulator
LILEEGLLSVTTRRVASRAQTSVSLIAYHFGGADNLVGEVLRLNLDALFVAQQELAADLDDTSLSPILEAYMRSLWTPAALHPDAYASVVIQEIYRQATASLQRQADARLEEGFLPLVRSMQPHLPHLDLGEVIWRICAITGTVLSLSQGAPSWQLFQAARSSTHVPDLRADIDRMMGYARTVLMAAKNFG